MQKKTDNFGKIIKKARKQAGYTVERLAEVLNISDRSIYSFESGAIKPRFDVLYKLIQVLGIDPNLIFYPDKRIEQSEIESLIRTLYRCDERSLKVVQATVQALLETAAETEQEDT